MDSLRVPFFVAALGLIALAVLIELGAASIIPEPPTQNFDALVAGDGDLQEAMEEADEDELQALIEKDKPPGLAIRYLALLDGILLFTIGLMGVGLLVKERLHGRLQGVVTLVFSFLLTLGSIVLIFVALVQVMLMVSLLLSAPFGTLAYLALYGFFNRAGANVALSLVMALKIGFAVCLVLAQQRFLQNKGLVVLILISFLNSIIVSFLHGLVPTFLVSITDGIAAIIGAILAAIFAIILLLGSLKSVFKALRVDRA